MKLVHTKESPESAQLDPAALGSAVLLLAEAAQAGIQVVILPDQVVVSADAAHLSENLAGRLRDQRQAILAVGQAVRDARNAGATRDHEPDLGIPF